MIKVRSLSAVLALGALTALPGCSMFEGHEQPAAMAAPAPAPTPAPAPAPSNPAQNALSHSLVRQVQTELKHNHMYRGKIDGIWGPNTRRGVTEFQRKHNLNPTGQLDDETLQALNLTAPSSSNTSGENMGNMNGGSNSMSNETGANGTNMPGAGGSMGTNTTGPGTGGTAAPPR